MNEIDFLDKKLTIEELDKFLKELMGYSAKQAEHPSRIESIEIYDEEGDYVHYYSLIGSKDITIVRKVLFLKETIDRQRGEWSGQYKVQQIIKQALGIG